MKENVLIIGATGLTGKAVAYQMNRDGFNVHILTRNIEKAKQLFSADYKILKADVMDEESLVRACIGIEKVFISLPEQYVSMAIQNIIKVGKRLQIKQIGYVSGSSVRKENAWHTMIRAHYESENLLINSGLNWTIFRPTMILDTLPKYANKGKAFIIGKQPQKWSWIYTGDMAKMISNAFQNEAAKNKKFTLFGPDAFTIPEAIDLFNTKFFPEAKPAKSTPFWMAGLISLFIGSKFRYVISLFKYFATHPQEGDPTEANLFLGTPVTGLYEYFDIYNHEMAENNNLME